MKLPAPRRAASAAPRRLAGRSSVIRSGVSKEPQGGQLSGRLTESLFGKKCGFDAGFASPWEPEFCPLSAAFQRRCGFGPAVVGGPAVLLAGTHGPKITFALRPESIIPPKSGREARIFGLIFRPPRRSPGACAEPRPRPRERRKPLIRPPGRRRRPPLPGVRWLRGFHRQLPARTSARAVE